MDCGHDCHFSLPAPTFTTFPFSPLLSNVCLRLVHAPLHFDIGSIFSAPPCVPASRCTARTPTDLSRAAPPLPPSPCASHASKRPPGYISSHAAVFTPSTPGVNLSISESVPTRTRRVPLGDHRRTVTHILRQFHNGISETARSAAAAGGWRHVGRRPRL